MAILLAINLGLRFVLELVLFAMGAGVLWLAVRPSLGAALLVIYLIYCGMMALLLR